MEPLAKSIPQTLSDGASLVAPVEKKRTKPRRFVKGTIRNRGANLET